MTSAINGSIPVNGTTIDAGPIQANFQTAHNEISGLQVSGQLMSGNGSTLGAVTVGTTLSLTGTYPTQTLGVGQVPVSSLGNGSGATSTSFWCGDGTWKTPAGTGGGVSEAPTDGSSYARGSSTWSNAPRFLDAAILAGVSTPSPTYSGAQLVINRNTSALPPAVYAAPVSQSGVWVNGADNEQANIVIDSHGGPFPAALVFRAANGTGAAPTQILNGNDLGIISWRGYDPTNGYSLTPVARLRGQAAENFTSTSMGTRLWFETNQIGTTSPTLQATIGPGLTVGAPTAPSGGMLVGDVNATRVMVNGTPITGGVGGPSNDNYATVTASGTTQGTAAIIATLTFTEVNAGSGGVVLPPGGSGGAWCKVRNSLASAVTVYPNSGGTINSLAANAGILVQPDTTGYFESGGAARWFTIP